MVSRGISKGVGKNYPCKYYLEHLSEILEKCNQTMICRSTGPDVEARADMNVADKRGQTPLCLGAAPERCREQALGNISSSPVDYVLAFLLWRLRSATERFV